MKPQIINCNYLPHFSNFDKRNLEREVGAEYGMEMKKEQVLPTELGYNSTLNYYSVTARFIFIHLLSCKCKIRLSPFSS
jgi:hypothetical protein